MKTTDMTTTEKFPFRRTGIDSDFIVTSDAFPANVNVSEAGKLQIRLRETKFPKGDYEVIISGRVTIDNLLNIPVARLSKDGGATWTTYSLEAETTTDGKSFTHAFPLINYSGANLDYIMQLKKSLATDTLTASDFDIMVKRVA